MRSCIVHRDSRSIAVRMILAVGVFSCSFVAYAKADVRNDDAELARVQGKWVRTVKTPNGETVKLVKEHRGTNTVLTATNEKGDVLYQHTSEFGVTRSGPVTIFTFSRRTITAGEGKGQTSDDTTSYVYRVADNRFIEARGLVEGDKSPPGMVVWERYRDE